MIECNVDDILCRMMVLSHLKGLKSVLGDEKYRAEFPELQSLDEKIVSHEANLRETLGNCGLEQIAEAPEEQEQIITGEEA